MKNRTSERVILILAAIGVASSQSLPGQTAAASSPSRQQAASTNEENSDDDLIMLGEFVVTGTQIRGVDPVGTLPTRIGEVEIDLTGALNTNELLATVPAAGMFNTLPQGSGDLAVTSPQVTLRGLGIGSTLLLVNGNRLAGMGYLTTTGDISFIPPSMIESVEIVTDAASAVYGADAVGGVVNVITKKRYEGAGVEAHYGTGDRYYTWDINVNKGWEWGNGSAMLAYTHNERDAILGLERDYFSMDHTAKGGSDFQLYTGGSILLEGDYYNLATSEPGGVLLDAEKYASLYPKQSQDSVFVGFEHKFNDSFEMNGSGFWTQQNNTYYRPTREFNGTINNTNPFFRPIEDETEHQVLGNFSEFTGRNSYLAETDLEGMGVMLEGVVKLPGEWALHLPTNFQYTHAIGTNHSGSLSLATNALAGTTVDTALNPYNLLASNRDVLSSIVNFGTVNNGKQLLSTIKAVADGPVVRLPGGMIRAAVGTEWGYSSLDVSITDGQLRGNGGLTNSARGDRTNLSAFAEVVVPLVGKENGKTGVRRLEVALSGRVDNYSDFGSTTNPKLGLTYAPTEDLSLRANYGTSYVAPSLADTTGAADSRAVYIPISPWTAPGDEDQFGRPTVIIAGGNPALEPQKGKSGSIGLDWTPKSIDGLTVSLTYWKTRYSNRIGIAPIFNPSVFYTNPSLERYYEFDPDLDSLIEFIGGRRLENDWDPAQVIASGNIPYVVVDATRHNFGKLDTDGVDVAVSYSRRFDFGVVHADASATKTFSRDTQALDRDPWADELRSASDLNLMFSAGMGMGAFDSNIALRHTSGFDVFSDPTQSSVDSFNVIDLHFSYDLDDLADWSSNMKITLNINNVFDEDPPYYNQSISGVTTGVGNTPTGTGTVGRLFVIGVEKRF